MRKQWAIAGVAALALLAGCQKDAGKVDLDQPKVNGNIIPKDYEAVSPDKVTVFLNIDDHPNVVRVCLDGLAFRTVSVKYVSLNTPAVERVPEWDAICKAAVASK